MEEFGSRTGQTTRWLVFMGTFRLHEGQFGDYRRSILCQYCAKQSWLINNLKSNCCFSRNFRDYSRIFFKKLPFPSNCFRINYFLMFFFNSIFTEPNGTAEDDDITILVSFLARESVFHYQFSHNKLVSSVYWITAQLLLMIRVRARIVIAVRLRVDVRIELWENIGLRVRMGGS